MTALGKIILSTPRQSYLDRPREDPKVVFTRLAEEIRKEREARWDRMVRSRRR
ncbi:hypothetical protein [Isoptericola sp. NPDC056134]|uniref:hypothetical protein n=1 Tax=Isoptericola sp. NPDC056134 TaxID=3345723 RepID=UPI0035E69311